MGAVTLLLALGVSLPGSLPAPVADTLIVEVVLTPGGERVVVFAEMGTDSALTLNGRTLGEFLEIELPPLVTLEELTDRVGPSVVVRWIPSRLQLAIIDTYGTLPVTRRRLDERMAESRSRPDVMSFRRGPAIAYSRDDTGADRLEIGYVTTRTAAFVSRSSEAGLAWTVNASPMRRLWISYRDDDAPETRYSLDARLAVRSGFVALSYREDGELGVQAAAMLGPLAAFADPSGDRYVVTLRGRIDAQLARLGERTIMRVSYGALDPSAFNIPAVPRR